MIREATLEDLDIIHYIETNCFDSDRISKRSLRNMILNPNSHLLVYTHYNKTAGYILTLFPLRSKLARHYSIAILPEYRKRGIAKKLLKNVERRSIGSAGFKLEVRKSNVIAAKLYKDLGYMSRRLKKQYYEDGEDAIEMVKIL